MRYDKFVEFIKVTQTYNRETGNFDETINVVGSDYASVVATSLETMRIVYGGLKDGSMTITLQHGFAYPYDFVRMDGKMYAVDQHIILYVKQALVVSEVHP